MKEHIYTIPVTEAFTAAGETKKCPFCALREKLERDELDLILGASMMEPDIRALTNELGFCDRHYSKMFEMKNRLGLALMLESHLESLKKELKTGNIFSRDIGAKSVERIEKLENSCYVCDRIEEKIKKMFTTASHLFNEEKEFRAAFENVRYFCLPHYREYMLAGKRALGKDDYAELVRAANEKVTAYLNSLKDDISLFCKKFDYRFDDLPWGESKDSVERSIRFLSGEKF
ncbi:MAG: hypothetical protein IJB49_06970 [Clostridia bacterium]|nr:hypothetical protein [Clostridia bacterium]